MGSGGIVIDAAELQRQARLRAPFGWSMNIQEQNKHIAELALIAATINGLAKRADESEKADGHLTICKVTTGWHICFGTPSDNSWMRRRKKFASLKDAGNHLYRYGGTEF